MNTENYKKALEQEKEKLEHELGEVARINPRNSKDWEATPADLNIPKSDKNDMGDAMEEYEGRMAVQVELENRLVDIKSALARIEEGTFGVCKVDGGEIEEKRLEANPAATTCMEHINE